MVSLVNLGMRFGGSLLFENVNIQLNPGNRYGVTGANGSGKSTLLKIISGQETGFEGTVNTPKNATIGILTQDHYRYEEWRVVDVVISGNHSLWEALQEKEKLIKEGDANGSRIANLEETIRIQEGYSAEARACRLLNGLGIEDQNFYGNMSRLSGGYKLRVLLARVLFQNPDILLLDEPTNHLDIISIAWLEHYLSSQYRGMIILVSHDRHFLNRVATHIADVDFHTITLYTGNYDDFLEARAVAMEFKIKEIASMEKRVEQLQKFVDRFRAKATKARQAQSRAKQIEKIEIPDIVRSSRRYPSIQFEPERLSGKEALQVINISKSFGEKKVLNSISFQLARGQKMAIVGPNGIGKSTLLKVILSQLDSDTGSVKWGFETRPAYFAQDHKENLKESHVTVFDWLYGAVRNATPGGVRSILGSMLFNETDTKKKIANLSGGEMARLILAYMMQQRPNVLILDEPTNHLDLESIESLETALSEFSGTVMFVSHDKNFVSSVADLVLELTPEGMEIHDGSYQQYLENLGEDYLERKGHSSASSGKPEKGMSDHQTIYRNRKELQKNITKTKKQLHSLEKEIETKEKSIEELNLLFANPALYETNDHDRTQEMQRQKETAEEELERCMGEWEKVHHELAALENEFSKIQPS